MMDIGAVHSGLELLNIDGFTIIREYKNNVRKKGFRYDKKKIGNIVTIFSNVATDLGSFRMHK